MAEAAAAVVAYETVETIAQIGVGAYFLAQPTMPLKARLTQIATSKDDKTRLSLARSAHSLSVVGSKAYIWGGETASNQLAGTEMHVFLPEATEKLEPEYSVIPAMAKAEGGKVPVARSKHAACAVGDCVAVFGGTDAEGQIVNEASGIWLFNTAYQNWELIEPVITSGAAPTSRHSARIFQDQGNLILYGGQDAQGNLLKDTWHFDLTTKTWTPLPSAPVSSSNAAVSEGFLHLISGTDSVSSDLHFLQLHPKPDEEQTWHTVPFPTNPLTPGPLRRFGAGLIPCSTGYGRQYLLYLFGAQPLTPESTSSSEPQPTTSSEAKETPLPPFKSDIWTYQLPSSTPEVKPTTQIYEALKPARIKDAIRSAIGVDSGKHSWAEVEVLPPTDLLVDAGKVHPGPRSFFACDVMKDKKGVVVWGGVNPKGEREGDGWIVRLE